MNSGQLLENRGGGAPNVCMMGKTVAALADVDSPQLSSPFVHIAKEVTVNGLQMLEVKAAL